ncbi:hypothetical protein BH10BAC4_BH10BAC4_22810 [soil metagenome]
MPKGLLVKKNKRIEPPSKFHRSTIEVQSELHCSDIRVVSGKMAISSKFDRGTTKEPSKNGLLSSKNYRRTSRKHRRTALFQRRTIEEIPGKTEERAFCVEELSRNRTTAGDKFFRLVGIAEPDLQSGFSVGYCGIVLSLICLKQELICYIQALLGHNSSITTEIYTHVTKKGFDKISSPPDNLDL